MNFSWSNWLRVFDQWPAFLYAFGQTLWISFLSLILTLIIGLIVGMILCGRGKVLPPLCKAYISLFQSTPLMIQVFIYYYVLPKMGCRLSVACIGVMGLALYTGAYAADIVASAIRAVPVGQTEAATSQGFSYLQTMRLIILPQAIKIGLPPMTNQAVNLIKNSSVLAAITGSELMNWAYSYSGSVAIYGPTFVLTGLLYLTICMPVSLLARYLERRSMTNA